MPPNSDRRETTRPSPHWLPRPVCVGTRGREEGGESDRESRMEMEIMLQPASPGDTAENGSHLANAGGGCGVLGAADVQALSRVLSS